jgi:nucleotide-binding universal stress UspA family protein
MIDSTERTSFHRILVPLTGTDSDAETMRMACWIGKRDKSKLYVMYVITIKRALPLEAAIESETKRAEEILERAERIAREEDYQIETDLLQARDVAPVIVDQARERKIDLVLLGVRYRRRFGEFNLGTVIPYVLKNAACQVMLYSQYNQ